MSFSNRTISEEEMTNSEYFRFGKGFLNNRADIKWKPEDTNKSANAHLLIVGMSGTGKTRLLKKIIEYLKNRGKQIYVIDFHGDIKTDGETVYTFTARKSKYGLSPFEFEYDTENGGINVQAEILTSVFKKSFIKNMGEKQRSCIEQFIKDCYAYVGITDEDETTWNKPIPTILTFKTLFEKISNKIDYNEANVYYEDIKKLIKLKNKYEKEFSDKSKEKIYKSMTRKLDDLREHQQLFEEYILEDKHKDVFNYSIKNDKGENLDISFYLKPENAPVFKSLSPYFKTIYESPIFNENKPPKAKGVVRYDISGFTNVDNPSSAIFFADVIAQRIFRSVKLRNSKFIAKHGEFARPEANTFIVVDESRLILPAGKDKDNPYHILNRITLEGRKFGLGLIGVSQRPAHFPPEMVSSIYTKVILEINKNDQPDAMKFLGVQNSSLFDLLQTKGTALVGQGANNFTPVALPWIKIDK